VKISLRVSASMIISVFSMPLSVVHAANTEQLLGNTLVCTHYVSGFPSMMTIYVTKNHVFLYHSSKSESSKVGVVYDFDKQRKGKTAGVNSYTSSARIFPDYIEIASTVENRTCGICDGKTIMVADKIKIVEQGEKWVATRNYKQWFPDGTKAAVPAGTDRYTCALSRGRVGVGE